MAPSQPAEHSEVGPPHLAKHWKGTEGARDVTTLYFERGVVSAGEAIMEIGLLALLGDPGLGKTFTAKTVAEGLRRPFHYLECAPGARGRHQAVAMLRALHWPHDARESLATLVGDLVEACAHEAQVLALDEIDRWGTDGVGLLRYLWSQQNNQTAFIFIGSKIERLIEANPALDSRIEHRVMFHRLDADQTKQALPAYHDVFQVDDQRLLARVHHLTGGEFRQIAILLKTILREAGGGAPRLTSDLLERAWWATGRGVR